MTEKAPLPKMPGRGWPLLAFSPGATCALGASPFTRPRPGASKLALGKICGLACLTSLAFLAGCTSVNIDRYASGEAVVETDESVVVLGRRDASNYDTEVDLISCVGDALDNGRAGPTVIPEREFIDRLYPWFEPRTAPMRVSALQQLVDEERVANAMEDYNISHIVWIDGKTETTDSAGSIGCSIGAGGAGCFGFGTWDQESEYEASIWDYESHELLGKVSTDAAGTSYMPALVVPIPIIARVQSGACKGMAEQLQTFFRPENGD